MSSRGAPWASSGATTGPLSPGTYYYICSVGSHCSYGQKIKVIVRAAPSTVAPSTAAIFLIVSFMTYTFVIQKKASEE